MSAIVPFDFSATTPARRRATSINLDVMSHSSGFPSISIKGKVFAIVKGDERTPLMKDVDGDMIPVPALQLGVVRANTRSRIFYAKSYQEGDSDGSKPTCFSHDGQRPDSAADQPQAANCQLCPHAQWGSKVSQDGQGGKGTACTVNTRLAVFDPKERLGGDKTEHTVYLMRIPAGSRANFSDAVKQADNAGKDYNEVVFKIGFDPEAPSPKLTFRPVGVLGDEVFEAINARFDQQLVKDIVGHPTVQAAERVAQAPAPALPPAPRAPKPALLTADEIDDIPSAPAPAPRAPKAPVLTEDDIDDMPAPAPAPAPRARAPKAAPAPVAAAPVSEATSAKAASLLGSLAGMLDMTDD